MRVNERAYDTVRERDLVLQVVASQGRTSRGSGQAKGMVTA